VPTLIANAFFIPHYLLPKKEKEASLGATAVIEE
jgi:hypothetical protein